MEGPQPPDTADIRSDLQQEVIQRIFADDPVQPDEDTEIFINPRGIFPKSGPTSHSGMTGRKTAAECFQPGENFARTVESDGLPVNLVIAKQRNGPTGDINLTFLKPYTRFESAAKFSQEDVPEGR